MPVCAVREFRPREEGHAQRRQRVGADRGRFWNGGRPVRAVTSSGVLRLYLIACPFKNSRAQLRAIRSTALKARDYRLEEKRGKTRQLKRSREQSHWLRSCLAALFVNYFRLLAIWRKKTGFNIATLLSVYVVFHCCVGSWIPFPWSKKQELLPTECPGNASRSTARILYSSLRYMLEYFSNHNSHKATLFGRF